MSCKMTICESDPEPITRLKDLGRLKLPKRPESRHVVNPNFMFFCQIVLLVIPITVLFAGLYFMNISSPLIVLICGAIIFVVLCIFMFVRPFKEEKCEEKKPFRRSYEYSPIKLSTNEPVKTELPKSDKRHSLHQDDDSDEEEDDERPSQNKNASTDTLLSIGTSDLPEISQGRTTAEISGAGKEAYANWRCKCCQMGCRGPVPRENDAVLQDVSQSKQSLPITMQESDGCTWEAKGYSIQTDQVSTPNSLGVVEEEGDTTQPDSVISKSPCSEGMSHTEKLLIPDVALSDSTNPSIPTSNLANNTSFSDDRNHPSQVSDRGTVTGYTTQESSPVTNNRRTKSPPKSPRKSISPQRFRQPTFSEQPSYIGDQSLNDYFGNNREKKGNSVGVICAEKPSPCEFRNRKDTFIRQPSSVTTTNFPQKAGHQFPKCRSEDINHTINVPVKDTTMDPSDCTSKLCPIKNKPKPCLDSNISSLPCNSLGNNHLTGSPEKPKSKKKRGFLKEGQNEEEALLTPGKQNIFKVDPQNNQSKSSSRIQNPDPESRAVRFQFCPTTDEYTSTDQNRSKQPILIKLFPTSSKDGVFSWEANPIKPNGDENNSSNNVIPQNRTANNKLQQNRTIDECVQTTAPEMVDTQTSAVFSTRASVHYSVPEVGDSMTTHGNQMHQTTSGSMVDFVLRPFSKVVQSVPTGDKKSRTENIKCSKRSKQCGNRESPEKVTIGDDSSKFDLLKIHSPRKKENHRASRNQREEESNPKSPKNERKSPRDERTAKFDICSIYYSSMQGKLYQPTRSGLLVTESSKEEVDQPQWLRIENAEPDKAPDKKKKENSPRHHKGENLGATHEQSATPETKRIWAKRKSDDERKIKSKCAKHDGLAGRLPTNLVSDEISLPWRKKTENVAKIRTHKDSRMNDKITFMFPPFNLDFSSGPCDDDGKISPRNLKCEQEHDKTTYEKQCTIYRKSKQPQSPGRPHEPKSKNQKTSHQTTTTLIGKSSSYENVVIEKVIKQKKRTLKKFK